MTDGPGPVDDTAESPLADAGWADAETSDPSGEGTTDRDDAAADGIGGGDADAPDAADVAGDALGELVSTVRFGKFASVGAVGALFDNSVLAVLKLVFAVPEMWAKVAGIETAILVMFLANEHWTFRDQGRAGRGPFVRRLARSHLVRSGGVAVQLVVYWTLTQQLAVTLVVFGTDLWFLAASPVAIAVAMAVNYTAESLFTWRVHR